ncbi:MAG: prepilin-type N-terminal cleavage/methylation domain-containing protein [Verrucomicrobiota bacterium]
MKLRRQIYAATRSSLKSRPDEHGLSLIEMMVTLAVGAIVLVILGLLSVYGLRSFLVMGNCAALDDKNRLAADQITRDLRQATRVLSFETDADHKALRLTNSLQGIATEYLWSADTRRLTCEKTDQPQVTCLTDCDSWEALFFQNLPLASATQPFLPATNALGDLDLNRARIVSLSWKCSRPVAGSRVKTESTQSLQVVLRNAAQP